jgi:hypothetical protein
MEAELKVETDEPRENQFPLHSAYHKPYTKYLTMKNLTVTESFFL